MSELSGQVAIVTGGASGIGAATVALLAKAGAAVISADIQPANKDAPGRFVRHDVTSEDSWKGLLADVLRSAGRLDILVNNAGITGLAGGWTNIETTSVEQWRQVDGLLRTDGARLLPPEGTGIGFDDLLERLPWQRL